MQQINKNTHTVRERETVRESFLTRSIVSNSGAKIRKKDKSQIQFKTYYLCFSRDLTLCIVSFHHFNVVCSNTTITIVRTTELTSNTIPTGGMCSTTGAAVKVYTHSSNGCGQESKQDLKGVWIFR